MWVEDEHVEEVAADLAAVARRFVPAGQFGAVHLWEVRGDHAGLERGSHPRLLGEHASESVAVVNALGDLAQYDEFTRRSAGSVAEVLVGDVERPTVRVVRRVG